MAVELFVTVETADGEVLTEGASSAESIGSYTKADHDDEALVLAFDQEVTVPTDPRNGNITGSPRYSSLRIKKFIDKSSPLLAGALTSSQILNVTLTFYRPAEGTAEEFYSIELENARICDIEMVSPDSTDPANDSMVAYENVSFTFEKIDWEHLVCSVSATDDIKGRV